MMNRRNFNKALLASPILLPISFMCPQPLSANPLAAFRILRFIIPTAARSRRIISSSKAIKKISKPITVKNVSNSKVTIVDKSKVTVVEKSKITSINKTTIVYKTQRGEHEISLAGNKTGLGGIALGSLIVFSPKAEAELDKHNPTAILADGDENRFDLEYQVKKSNLGKQFVIKGGVEDLDSGKEEHYFPPLTVFGTEERIQRIPFKLIKLPYTGSKRIFMYIDGVKSSISSPPMLFVRSNNGVLDV